MLCGSELHGSGNRGIGMVFVVGNTKAHVIHRQGSIRSLENNIFDGSARTNRLVLVARN